MKSTSLTLLTLFTAFLIAGCNADTTSATEESPTASPSDTLTEDQKYSLAYMWHEEKLAKELYLELNKINPAQQLENIALNSEVKHIAKVQEVVAYYDINITNLADYEIEYSKDELENMPVGFFAVPEIQDLYNMLYNKGLASKQSALEVDCMVEVVDINDLDKFLVTADNNQYLIDAFTFLHDGSYTHYWAFDKGLKNMGVTDGCCSLGTDYCHPEYPQNENGGAGKGKQ
ncbi:DUF2202 domain-containing protein [Sulfurovum sp. NBC37-1]|uniref:DUF2202 domain-containing protein n=1 Tax=Sulfurovum sp. (strain NBC37-1) TaxID=387093 RepID=UPI0001587D9F|nr:DUF2202 domain-containing protein [Sulfurovum sp. NBC37-1]BAF72345.1 conserved hypothetical protein [Sulfurovum sp. NBC37-1]